jgi:hypothetical protein
MGIVDDVANTAPLLLSNTVYDCTGNTVLPGVNVTNADGVGEVIVAVTMAVTDVGAPGTE